MDKMYGWNPIDLYIVINLSPEYEYDAELDCIVDERGYSIDIRELEEDEHTVYVREPDGTVHEFIKNKDIIKAIKQL